MAVFFLSGATVTLVQASYDISDINIQLLLYEPCPAQAGGYMDLWIKIENNGSRTLRDLTCVLLEEYPFSIDPNEEPERDIGSLPESEVIVLQYKVRVADNAVGGWNEITLNCSAKYYGNTSASFDINVKPGPEFSVGSVTADPLKITSDMKDVKLTVEIQNIGEASAKLVTAELNLPTGFTASESYSDRANLGTIENDSNKEAVFYIDVSEEVKPGIHNTSLTIQYKANDNYITKEIPIELKVKSSALFKIEQTSVKPSELAAGDKAELRIKLSNVGTEEAESISVRIYKKSDQPFDFEENYDYIGNLKPNQTAEAVFTFTVTDDANLKEYLLNLEIRHVDGSDVKLVTKTIPIEVSNEKGFQLLFLVIPIVCIIALMVWWKYNKKQQK